MMPWMILTLPWTVIYEISKATQYAVAQVISFEDYDCAEKKAN
jgi:hypothetical protein